jgi:hypothetical protein
VIIRVLRLMVETDETTLLTQATCFLLFKDTAEIRSLVGDRDVPISSFEKLFSKLKKSSVELYDLSAKLALATRLPTPGQNYIGEEQTLSFLVASPHTRNQQDT